LLVDQVCPQRLDEVGVRCGQLEDQRCLFGEGQPGASVLLRDPQGGEPGGGQGPDGVAVDVPIGLTLGGTGRDLREDRGQAFAGGPVGRGGLVWTGGQGGGSHHAPG